MKSVPPVSGAECRTVPGHEDYVVTSNGEVWSRKGRTWRKLKPKRAGHCYLSVCLDSRCYEYIHTLVLRAFVGPRPQGMECNHVNGDPHDNRLTNLRYGTRSDNMRDRVRIGSQRGSHNGASKLNESDVIEIRSLAEEGLTQKEIAGKFGVSRSLIGLVVRRVVWDHV